MDFRGVDERIGAVADLDELLLLLVLFGVRLRFLDQPLDIRVAQTAGGRDADGLLLARAQILGRNIDDAVGVDVESHLNLRHAARRECRSVRSARESCCPSTWAAHPEARGWTRRADCPRPW